MQISIIGYFDILVYEKLAKISSFETHIQSISKYDDIEVFIANFFYA